MGGLRRLRGEPLVAGTGAGSALVTTEPLSFWGGVDPATGAVIDRRHPLRGAVLTGRVLVLPQGRGSCSASGVLLEAIRAGTAPTAILVRQPDPIIGLGAILGAELYGRPLPVVRLTPADWATIADGAWVAVAADGTVEVGGIGDREQD